MKTILRLVAVTSLAVATTACWSMGSGEKIGVVTKLARHGVFCKTWEGQIVRGGLNGGSGVVGAAFDFTIEDDAEADDDDEVQS